MLRVIPRDREAEMMTEVRTTPDAVPKRLPTLSETLKRIRDEINEKLRRRELLSAEISALRRVHDKIENEALPKAG